MNNDERTKMRVQSPSERVTNFKEVELGFTKEEALREANRCLQCVNPRCVKGCPVNIMIPAFIKAIKEDNLEEAYKILSNSSNLCAVCGRVCPQETQCEGMCVRGLKGEPVAIGSLERYVADQALLNNFSSGSMKPKNGKKVAVVGSGPSGLTCAGDLAKAGFEVTIYETLHKAGGVLTYGIPEFRLPKSILDRYYKKMRELGIKFRPNFSIGGSTGIRDLLEDGYKSVFIGTGGHGDNTLA